MVRPRHANGGYDVGLGGREVREGTIAASASQTIWAAMVRKMILDALSSRAPMIVVITLCAALLAYWMDAPLWLPYGLAIVVGSFAFVLMAARNRRSVSRTDEELGAQENTSWIANELAGRGSPSGSYLLAFFSLVTIMLTGFEGPYATPAWAGLALGAAWGIANARYPVDKDSDR